MPRTLNLYQATDNRIRAFAVAAIKRARANGYQSDIRTALRLAERMWHLGWCCAWCGGAFECIDHVMPLTLGGPDMLDNLVPACKRCNSLKGGLHPDRWVEGETQDTGDRCGTSAGYRKHHAKGTKPCAECRAAQTAYTKPMVEALRLKREALVVDAPWRNPSTRRATDGAA